jgi:hypothetical protein
MLEAPLVFTAWVVVNFCSRFAAGQGIDIKVPIPIIDDILKGDDESDIEHRWWFWLVIGLISAIFITLSFFTVRGCINYRRYKKELKQQKQVDEEEVDRGESTFTAKIGRVSVNSEVGLFGSTSCRDIDRRTASHSVMRPPGSIVGIEARLMKYLRRLNPRVVIRDATEQASSLPVHSTTIPEESSGEDDKEKRDFMSNSV